MEQEIKDKEYVIEEHTIDNVINRTATMAILLGLTTLLQGSGELHYMMVVSTMLYWFYVLYSLYRLLTDK